jgi:hypothetical protein
MGGGLADFGMSEELAGGGAEAGDGQQQRKDNEHSETPG